MRLTMSDRRAVIKAWSSQYRKARKKDKGRVLDELVALTRYNRWYVVGLLRWDGKVIRAGRRKNRMGHHLMIYSAPGEMMKRDIHALNIQAHTPDEIY